MLEREITEKIVEMSTDMKIIKKAVLGNGQPGLVDRMTVAETELKNHLKEAIPRWPMYITAGCAVVAILVSVWPV